MRMERFGGAQEASQSKMERTREKIAKEGAVRAVKVMRAAFLPEMRAAIDAPERQVVEHIQKEAPQQLPSQDALHRDSDRVHAERLHQSHHAI